MERAKRLVSTIEHLISTKAKQHIVGGLLFSAAMFLGALSATVLTMKVESASEEVDNNRQNRYEDDTHDY